MLCWFSNKMAEGLPVDSYSPSTLERIVDGVLEMEIGQERLMDLEEEVQGVAVRDYDPQNEGEVHLTAGDRVRLLYCEAVPSEVGVYHVVNLRSKEEGKVPLDAVDFVDEEDAPTDTTSPDPGSDQFMAQLLSGNDSSAGQQQGGSCVGTGGEEQSDLDFNTDGLLARQLLRGASDGAVGKEKSDPAAGTASHGSSRNKPHRSRGVTLTQRPYFQSKSGPVVGGTNLEAKSLNVGYHTLGSGGTLAGESELPAATVSLPSPRSTAASSHTLEERQSKRQGIVWGNEGGSPDVTSTPTQFRHIEKFNILTLGGVDKETRPVVIFSACRMPSSYKISHENLFEYILYTMDKYVENDYTIVYFHHGLTSANKPGVSLIMKLYKELDRKYKKNLKKLYIVHPSRFLKVVMALFKPIISYKFGRKMLWVDRLEQLEETLYVNQLDIPEEVRRHDKQLGPLAPPKMPASQRSSVFHEPLPTKAEMDTKHRQFGASLTHIQRNHDGSPIPPVVQECVTYLERYGLDVLGVFRRSPSMQVVQDVKAAINRGEPFHMADYDDPHLAAGLLKMFLREMPEPALTYAAYDHVLLLSRFPAEEQLEMSREFVQGLPEVNKEVIQYVIGLMVKIVEHTEENKMTPANLAIVLGPNLVWSQSEVASLTSIGEINSFVLLLINKYGYIF